MTTNGVRHCTDEELLGHVDSQGVPDPAVQAHLSTCDRCASRLRDVKALDRGLRSMPLERAPHGFTESVLARVGLRPEESFFVRIVDLLPQLVALLLVLGTISAVLLVWNAPADLSGQGSESVVGGAIDRATEGITAAFGKAGAFMARYLALEGGSALVAQLSLIAGIVIALAALDRLIGRRGVGR